MVVLLLAHAPTNYYDMLKTNQKIRVKKHVQWSSIYDSDAMAILGIAPGLLRNGCGCSAGMFRRPAQPEAEHFSEYIHIYMEVS